ETVGDRRRLLARTNVDAREILRALRSFQLREVDDIHRRSTTGGEAFQRFGQRQLRILIRQRNGPVGGGNGNRRPSGEPRQFFLEKRGVAQRRGHQEEARSRQRQQGK